MAKKIIKQCKFCCNQAIRGNYCPYHYNLYWQGIRRKSIEKQQHQKTKLKEEDHALKDYFTYHISHRISICENCQQSLPMWSEFIIRSHQAHILPKKTFKSVRGHLDNHLTLGGLFSTCGCHAKFDNSWMKAQAMPIFPLAVEKVKSFIHLLTNEELSKLPEVFKKECSVW